MDVTATVSATTEDGAGNTYPNGHNTSQNDADISATEDSLDARVGDLCCQKCGETFQEEATYLEHCHQHHTEKHLNDHLDSLPVAEKDNYAANICSVCSLSFAELSELHLHMEKSHGQASQKESETKQKSYECPDCGKCYVSVGYLINHQRSHTPAAKSLFNNLKDLKKKSFNCEFCGRTYSRASALDAHRRYHKEKLVKSKNRNSGDVGFTDESVVDGKPKEIQKNTAPGKHFNCECGKSFTALIGLKTHRRFCTVCEWSPEGRKEKMKKTYHCNDCQKEFGSFLALLNHQRWHAKQSGAENKFKCEECGKTFVSSTFYNKHKRLFHSGDTAAKSFTNQVTQLQKKSFECQECGLKFSRASALNSHQLHHRNVFGESEINEIKNVEQYVESRLPVDSHLKEDHPAVYDTEEEDGLCYGPGDFNVQVISASESDSESVHEPNPDLELLCESDQEMRDSGTETSRVSKSAIDLNIVQVDFEQAEEPIEPQASQIEGEATQMRFNCPECYRWFTSAGSLSIHRMWHRIRRKRQQNQPQSTADVTSDTGSTVAPQCSDTQHGIQDPSEDVMNQAEELEKKDLTCGEVETQQQQDPEEDGEVPSFLPGNEDEAGNEEEAVNVDDVDMDTTANGLEVFTHTKDPYFFHNDGVEKKRVYLCTICGKQYFYLSSLQKHKDLHERNLLVPLPPKTLKYQCRECGKYFSNLLMLCAHMKDHKTRCLPKCNQCHKIFTSLKSWMIHVDTRKQKPFWCLSCTRGFANEDLLTKHMQIHRWKQHKCDVCHKSFPTFSRLGFHYNIHTDKTLRPFECTLCGKTFPKSANTSKHVKKHLSVYAGSEYNLPELKKSMIIRKVGVAQDETPVIPGTDKGPEREKGNKDVKKLPEGAEMEKSCDDADSGDHEKHEDCGEPVHYISSYGQIDESELENVQPQDGQELNKRVTKEIRVHGEHKYWEWECVVCDKGFDAVEKLHSHYIKHATGELPFPQSDTEG